MKEIRRIILGVIVFSLWCPITSFSKINRSGFIEWETEPVPIDFKDEFVTFMWMAGIDVSEDGKGIMLRLFNAGGRPERARLHWDQKRPGVLYLSSPFEDKGKRINGPIQLSAYGIITIRVEGFN